MLQDPKGTCGPAQRLGLKPLVHAWQLVSYDTNCVPVDFKGLTWFRAKAHVNRAMFRCQLSYCQELWMAADEREQRDRPGVVAWIIPKDVLSLRFSTPGIT